MGRGPKIKDEEIKQARSLRAEGKTIREIASILNRSAPTVLKMLKLHEAPL